MRQLSLCLALVLYFDGKLAIQDIIDLFSHLCRKAMILWRGRIIRLITTGIISKPPIAAIQPFAHVSGDDDSDDDPLYGTKKPALLDHRLDEAEDNERIEEVVSSFPPVVFPPLIRFHFEIYPFLFLIFLSKSRP